MLSQTVGTVIVAAILVTIVALIVYGMIKDRKKGRHICGGNCSKCHGSCAHSQA